MTTPIPEFPEFLQNAIHENFSLNPCTDACHEQDEHAHLRSPSGNDGIVWADGRVSSYDLTLPARLTYPTYGR